MKRPSFQFYPADWLGNSNLRRCSFPERGVWVDVMCLMHDQDEYGILRWPLKEIAQAVGCQVSLLKGLASKGVLKGCDTGICEPFIYTPRSGRKDGDPVTLVDEQPAPIWYSSRMVKDEYVRTIRGESSRFGVGKDDTPKDAPKPPFGDGSSSSSSSSTSVSSNGENSLSSQKAPADTCPHQKIIDLYHEILPSARRIRDWTPSRQAALRARWRERAERRRLEWWSEFFGYISRCDFLMGKVHTQGRRPFEVSLDWILKPENFVKIMEGAYEEK